MLEWLYFAIFDSCFKNHEELTCSVELIGLYDRCQYFPLKCPEQ